MDSTPPFSTFLHLAHVEAIEKLYAQFLQNPSSLEPTWRYFFEGMQFGSAQQELPKERGDLRIYLLIDLYRRFGHLQARINPIAVNAPETARELTLSALGFEEKELEQLFPTAGLLPEEKAPLSKIIALLQQIYCGTKAIEYMGVNSIEMEKWLQKEIEPCLFSPSFSIEKKKKILEKLNQAELFETFLHTKYVGQKRFSLEGGESLIPMLAEMVETGAELGMEECVIGMSHRGRLNVLANIMNKSFSTLFSEFEDYFDPNAVDISGDVKYHKGFSSTITTAGGKEVHISLTANPSHLESVNPVAEGKAKAKQQQKGDSTCQKVMPILIHGDASLAGQGIVYETLQLYRLSAYCTGGTLHLVVNNHIGFTTLPYEYKSTRYCSSIALAFGCPVFHVNAEDPEGCIFATQLALRLRALFHCDVFLELHCYRKYGHNEGDEPFFTQPIEYQLIKNKKSIREIYRDALEQEGVVAKEMALQLEEEFKKALHFELEEMKLKKEAASTEAFGGIWENYHKADLAEIFQPVITAVEASLLQQIAERFCEAPKNFELHKKLLKLIEERKRMGAGQRPLDWAMAEHLAFGSLLWEGIHVRLAGQDCQRGTFTQRHASWVNQSNGEKYFPLSHLKADQGVFTVVNSSLSEYAALGFEYGYTLAYPSALVLWEAQFGDFANGAQIIFDQYIAAAAQKWKRHSGLVVLLPHGYEGQGPEHSSARLERFLQLAAESNMQVTNPTTPAQYFHLLRRQMKRRIRLPLIVVTPKGLLRHPGCTSQLHELATGHFQEILEDPQANYEATRILLCSGHIYYDLENERRARQADLVALVRLEQLYPLDQDKLLQILKKYTKAEECLWVQEEPRNMGAFSYLEVNLKPFLPETLSFHYVGRNPSASTATGSHKLHSKEHQHLMDTAFHAI